MKLHITTRFGRHKDNFILYISANDLVTILLTNKTCDDFRKGFIDSLEDCRSLLPYATSYNKNVTKFKEEAKENQEKYPRGCYIYTNTNNNDYTLYFNPHGKGLRHRYSQPICKKSKNIK